MGKILAFIISLIVGSSIFLALLTQYTESRASLVHERAMAKALIIQANSQARLDMLPYAIIFSSLALVVIVAIVLIVVYDNRSSQQENGITERIIERQIIYLPETSRRLALKALSEKRDKIEVIR